MADIAKLVEELSQLTVLEAADLAKALEEALGRKRRCCCCRGCCSGRRSRRC